MGLTYNVSAKGVLGFLGLAEANSNEFTLSRDRMPELLWDFLGVALNHPLLQTADFWSNGKFLSLYQDYIEQEIEDTREDWEENPDSYQDDTCYQLSQLPRERWSEKVSEFLVIGSDYGAGVVRFGIQQDQLDDSNPPVFMNHETDELTDWRLWRNRVSDYLLEVVYDCLWETCYDTAHRVLEKNGFIYTKFTSATDIQRLVDENGIDSAALHRIGTSYLDASNSLACCYDQYKPVLYMFKFKEQIVEMCEIKKAAT